MIILSRGTKVLVVNSGGSSSETFDFTATSPITQGELILHNLGTLTPIVTAIDLNGLPITGINVVPVYNNQNYEPENLSSLVYNGSFTGVITLKKQ